MKLLIFLLFISTQANAVIITPILTGEKVDPLGWLKACERDRQVSPLGCAMSSTTAMPTIVIISKEEVSNEDALLLLADEVTREIDSTEQIKKTAKYLNTSNENVIEATLQLLNTEEGLSFIGLKEEIKQQQM